MAGECEVIGDLNHLAGTEWARGPATRYLRERLLDGFTVEQCCRALREARERGMDLHPKRIFSQSVFPALLAPASKRKAADPDGIGLVNAEWIG